MRHYGSAANGYFMVGISFQLTLAAQLRAFASRST